MADQRTQEIVAELLDALSERDEVMVPDQLADGAPLADVIRKMNEVLEQWRRRLETELPSVTEPEFGSEGPAPLGFDDDMGVAAMKLLGGSGVNTYDRPGGKAAVVRSSDELDDGEVSLGGVGGVYSITRTFQHYYVSGNPVGWGDGNPAMVYGGQTGTSNVGRLEVPYAGTVVAAIINWIQIGGHVAGNMYFRVKNVTQATTGLESAVTVAAEDMLIVRGGTLAVAQDDQLILDAKASTPSSQIYGNAVVTVFIRADDEI
jgi:hypothetical protein